MQNALMQDAIEAWRIYRDFEHSDYLVQPSIPILYFGDIDKYMKSSFRMVTVGFNPSKMEFQPKKNEFPKNAPFTRFADVASVYPQIINGSHYPEYLKSLNRYFYEKPYSPWFKWYEKVLKGFDCSFYGMKINTALHTDLLSPLATDPTWGGLSSDKKDSLCKSGVPLWHRVIESLLPHVILMSMKEAHLKLIKFKRKSTREIIFTIERDNPYHVYIEQVEIKTGNVSYLVFGDLLTSPFGSIKDEYKDKIGPAVLNYMRSHASAD